MKKQAVLTIDDAPSSGMNEKLAFLASKGIHAIWFCNGVHLNAQREAALRALREGHLLANHAWEHIRFSEHSFEEAQSQVRRTEQLLEALYREAGVRQEKRMFRFPFGDKGSSGYRPRLQDWLRREGYQPCLALPDYRDVDWFWTYDSKDWALNRPEPVPGFETYEQLSERLRIDDPAQGLGLHQPGGLEVVLTHDHARTTPFFCRLVGEMTGLLEFVHPSAAYTGGQG